MKKHAVVALSCAVALIVSCARYQVTKEIKNGSALSKCKKSGVIFRLPAHPHISNKLHRESLSHWLDGYRRVNGLVILDNMSKNLTTIKDEFDRFNQRTEDDDYLYYKSMGIITQYLNQNRQELEKIMSDSGLDSFIIYEVDCGISAEMQYTDFRSMIVITDSSLRVVYLDHQWNEYDTNEYSPKLMRNRLLDDINGRFIDLMLKLKYIKEK